MPLIDIIIGRKKSGNTDYSRNPDQRIDYSWNNHAQVVENKGNEIKIEKTD